jgi:hypothetical protein
MNITFAYIQASRRAKAQTEKFATTGRYSELILRSVEILLRWARHLGMISQHCERIPAYAPFG